MKLKKMIFAIAVALTVAASAQVSVVSGQWSVASEIAVAAAAQEQQSEQPPVAPKLIIKSMMHDFGEVESGSPLSYSFVIKNEGKADLLIKSVTPG